MVNFNGNIVATTSELFGTQNRALRYGDALTETLRVVNGKVIFWEDHYLKLMAAMRVLRMEIPMSFTMEFLEDEILKTIRENELENNTTLVNVFVFRNVTTNKILPETREVAYFIETKASNILEYSFQDDLYEVELFKDFYVSGDMLSTINTTNKILNVVGSIFADENDYHDCLVLNHNKMVVGSLVGNLFLVKANTIKTAPLNDGSLNTVIRDKIIKISADTEDFVFEEASISPFELQKADELFIATIKDGLIPITKYRKKEYTFSGTTKLLGKLNEMVKLG
ncbi:aminotransferase class IV [Aurantibacter crassamenti]|uniref:aminotransferase class IV n=1 Tax=Aurantibacter crassamenti TaxID=1837375 RepID=UPI00193A5E18|nr:aminotransferase class IV [Aurantibacter crassamenti]MBM1106840.1 aminotransferase class IV [Aurantibacter crassamenti]